MTAAWQKGLRELSKKPPSQKDLDQFLNDLLSEKNERGAALMASAIVETVLQNTLMEAFREEGGVADRLFGPDRPLASFSAKIWIGFAMSLYDADIRSELDKVREIRNAFAHAMTPIGFGTIEVKTACAQLQIVDTPPPTIEPKTLTDARLRYLAAAAALLSRIAKITNRLRMAKALRKNA